MQNRASFPSHTDMYFRAERTILVSLLILALRQDHRVSSLALPARESSSRYGFPGDNAKDNSLGYFGVQDKSYRVNKCNTTTDEKESGTVTALVGGQHARIGQFPWMAIIHRLIGAGQIGLCGGTIISVRWILTAGHCIEESPRRFLIVLGDIDKSRIGYDTYDGPGTAMITTKGALHPQYSQQVNDIGLLWMPRDITFNHVIQPIRLAGRQEANVWFAGETGVVVGWGRESPNQTGGSQRLKFLALPIIGFNECARSWRVYESHVCTATGSYEDACQGDSGGPLVVEANGEYLQVGVVSYGDKECSSILPGVFTRVSSFSSWIQRVTGIQYR